MTEPMSKDFWRRVVKDWEVVRFLNDNSPGNGVDIVETIVADVSKGRSPAKAIDEVINGAAVRELTGDEIDEAAELAREAEREFMRIVEFAKEAREGARRAEMARIESSRASWITRNATTLLSIFISFMAFALTAALMFVPTIAPEAAPLINVAFGAIFSLLAGMGGYYYGRTNNHDKKLEKKNEL